MSIRRGKPKAKAPARKAAPAKPKAPEHDGAGEQYADVLPGDFKGTKPEDTEAEGYGLAQDFKGTKPEDTEAEGYGLAQDFEGTPVERDEEA